MSVSTEVSIPVECREAISAVRDDEDSTSWAALTYVDGSLTELTVLATGSDGDGGRAGDALRDVLQPSKIVFAIVRTTEQIDDTTAIKFCFVNFVGESCDAKLRQRQTVHSGSVREIFEPFHGSISADTPDEVSHQIIDDVIQTTSGRKTRVRDEAEAGAISQGAASGQQAVMGSAPSKGNLSKLGTLARGTRAEDRVEKQKNSTQVVPKKLGNVNVDDIEAIQQAIADVRSDAHDANWVVLTYVAGAKPDTLTLKGVGSGGVEEMLTNLDESNTYYCLSRHTDKIDDSVTVKFAFVKYIGPKTPRMLKARMSTHKGAIEEICGQAHVSLNTEEIEEVTEAALLDKIGAASGSKSSVL
jgi:hypothetical protein